MNRSQGISRQGWGAVGRALSAVETVFILVGGLLLAGVTVMIVYDVLVRYLFDQSLAWSVQMSEYVLLALAFLVGSWVTKQGGHVRSDLLFHVLPARVTRILEASGYLVAAVACGLLFWYGLTATISDFQRNVVIWDEIPMPKYILLAFIPAGSLLMCLRCLEKAFVPQDPAMDDSNAENVAGED